MDTWLYENMITFYNHCCGLYSTWEWEEWHEQRRSGVFLHHKDTNKCSGRELNKFSVLLLNVAWCQIHRCSCTCAMCILTHASRRAPAPCSWSLRDWSFRCTGSFWWSPATRAPTWTWYRHSRWCSAGGWTRCKEQCVIRLVIPIYCYFMCTEYVRENLLECQWTVTDDNNIWSRTKTNNCSG